MQINKININPYIKFTKKQTPNAFLNFGGLKNDVFQKNNTPSYTPKNIPFGIDKSLMKTPQIFLKPQIAKYDNNIIVAAAETAKIAKILKKGLDEKYGKDNYVFISLGTSPALLGKGLEFMGQDVRYVPVSHLASVDCSKTSDDKIRAAISPKYSEFLDSINLNKETISKDKRHYILCDYTATGRSLDMAEYAAKNILGIESNNFEKLSINDFLTEYSEKNCHFVIQKLIGEYINFYMASQVAEDYAGVPHIGYDELSDFDIKRETICAYSDSAEKFEKALRCFI